jgi:diadenosine tetraphosphatase ApaH/serine/threonine PP2A family protein phosphatase
MKRRTFLSVPAAAGLAAAAVKPANAEVRVFQGKPTLFVRGQPEFPCFYALTDCPGGRWSFDEAPARSIRQFVEAGFRLFQVDLWLETIWAKPGPLNLDLARRQIRGVVDLCPEAAIVIRWHVNAPPWWLEQNPSEMVRWVNGDFEKPEHTVPVRLLMDDLKRVPRTSFASEKWFALAKEKTRELLRGLAKSSEGNALAGLHIANGVYGEWHYWAFFHNEPDSSAPMQAAFDRWRRERNKPPAPVPDVEARAATDDGIFRDPQKREAVSDYYRCQQELTADRMIELCRDAKANWPRPLLTGVFCGYFFSMFNRQAAGGHLELQRVLASPHVDYLSAPQAYGKRYRDPGECGITRALVESVRMNGKLFLDEMDESPSWRYRRNVDVAFELQDVPLDIAIIRRNVVQSYSRGAGLWFYDFGPANMTGWWADSRLMFEITRLKTALDKYHRRGYTPVPDIVFVFDTEVFYATGSTPESDPFTDPLAVNQTIVEAWRAGAAIETIHLADLGKLDLSRIRVVVFANTWVLDTAQRAAIRKCMKSCHVVFQGPAGYSDGKRLGADLQRELTGFDTVSKEGLHRRENVWFAPKPPLARSEWRRIFAAAGAHLYCEEGDVVHAGGGVVLIHSATPGERAVQLRNGRSILVTFGSATSVLLDPETGETLLS